MYGVCRILPKELSNLQEAYLEAEDNYPILIAKEILMPFVRHSVKLKKLKITLHHLLVFNSNDLIELNQERLLISGACCMMIELEVHKGHPLIQFVPVALNSSSINLKIIS